jgi:hypothetical protein
MLYTRKDVRLLHKMGVLLRVVSFAVSSPECPYRAAFNWKVSQGKPWAKFSWPFGPKTRLYPRLKLREVPKLQR